MPNADFLNLFDNLYAPRLGNRAQTFRDVFAALKEDPFIVETGTIRHPRNWEGTGCSTILFDRYVQCCGGRFDSIDIEPRDEIGRLISISPQTHFITSDSITFLGRYKSNCIDLLYLDSMDGSRPGSADYMMAEFTTAKRALRPGSIIFIDDVQSKGTIVAPHINIDLRWPLITKSDMQMAWRVPA